MCGQIGCNKSEFHKKKLMGYWGGWRGIRGIWNLFAPPAFPDSFQRATSISWGKKIVKFPKKSFLKENCYFRESPHTDRQRPQGSWIFMLPQGKVFLNYKCSKRDIYEESKFNCDSKRFWHILAWIAKLVFVSVGDSAC